LHTSENRRSFSSFLAPAVQQPSSAVTAEPAAPTNEKITNPIGKRFTRA
jgi:hypothetical protein